MQNSVTADDLSPWELIGTLQINIDYFDKAERYPLLQVALENLKNSVEICATLVKEISSFAPEYDFDKATPGNGYRSFIAIFDSAVKITTTLATQLIKSRENFLFKASSFAR